mgnify:CR=1 FL=1
MTERVKRWTDGPWVYHMTGDRYVMSGTGHMPAVCQTPKNRKGSNPEWVANAHLIAAAPDLVEALEELAEVERSEKIGAEWKRDLHAALKKTDAALAKAYGETNHD